MSWCTLAPFCCYQSFSADCCVSHRIESREREVPPAVLKRADSRKLPNKSKVTTNNSHTPVYLFAFLLFQLLLTLQTERNKHYSYNTLFPLYYFKSFTSRVLLEIQRCNSHYRLSCCDPAGGKTESHTNQKLNWSLLLSLEIHTLLGVCVIAGKH